MTSKISVKDAINQLKQMFSDYDEEIISNALVQSKYDMTTTIELLLSYANDDKVEVRGQNIQQKEEKKQTPIKQKPQKKKKDDADDVEEVIQFTSKLGPCKQRKLYYSEDKSIEKEDIPHIYTANIPIEEKKSNS